MTSTEAITTVLRGFDGASILRSSNGVDYAVELAVRGWAVFPLTGKVPAIPSAHPDGDPLRGVCKGTCGRVGHGVLDATTDVAQVAAWWGGPYRRANIGARVPEPLVVVDVDPRHGGDDRLTEHEARHGALPGTLTVWSGRGDGGRHLYFRRPPGKLSSTRLGTGLDVKTSAGYCVVPPSRHPEGRREPYRWEFADPAVMPGWLAALMRPESPPPRRVPRAAVRLPGGPSVADDYSATASWRDLLEPHGWRCLDGDGDRDGARWRHPTATAPVSATVRHGCLFVYSPNTPFDVTEAGDPHGVTRFRALAVLNHGGDLPAAARALRAGAAT